MRKQYVLTRVVRGSRLFGVFDTGVEGTVGDTNDIRDATKFYTIQGLLLALRETTPEFAQLPDKDGSVDAMWTIGVVEVVDRLDFKGEID